MWVREVTQALLQKGILQIIQIITQLLIYFYLCQEILEQILQASSNLDFSEFNLSSLLLSLGLVKAVTD